MTTRPQDISTYLDASGRTVRLETGQDGNRIDLSTEAVDHLIAQLVLHRARMTPEIPTDRPDRLPTVFGPWWFVPHEKVEGHRPIFLRHPGTGWTAYFLPEEQALAAAEALLKEVPENPSMLIKDN